MNDFDGEKILSNLAAELENDPAFMAHVLALYCQFEGLDKNALASELGIPALLLARLALCKRPDADAPNFIGEINEIADFVLADEIKLTQIIRTVDSLNALGNAEINDETKESLLIDPFSANILAAARDRDEGADETTEDEDEQ